MAQWMSKVLLTMERALMLPTRSSFDVRFADYPAGLVLGEADGLDGPELFGKYGPAVF